MVNDRLTYEDKQKLRQSAVEQWRRLESVVKSIRKVEGDEITAQDILARIGKSEKGSDFLSELRENPMARPMVLTSASRGGVEPELAVEVFYGGERDFIKQRNLRRLQSALEILQKTGGTEEGKVLGKAVSYPWSKRTVKDMLMSLTQTQREMVGIGLNNREFGGVDLESILTEKREPSPVEDLYDWAMWQEQQPRHESKEKGRAGDIDELIEETNDEVSSTLSASSGDGGGGLSIDDLLTDEATQSEAAKSITPVRPQSPPIRKRRVVAVTKPATPPPSSSNDKNNGGQQERELLAEALEACGKAVAVGLAQKLRGGSDLNQIATLAKKFGLV